jgi:hypothetical protein
MSRYVFISKTDMSNFRSLHLKGKAKYRSDFTKLGFSEEIFLNI